jgi:glycosyltransferase involved in cell wall biosynthesis
MACGTPVACSRVGAMPEFVRHTETGYVFDTEEELASILRDVSANPVLVERMGFRARSAVEQEYDLHICGRKLAAVYRDLLGECSQKAAA